MLQRMVELYLNYHPILRFANERDAACGAGFIEWPAMRVALGKVWRATKIVLAVLVIGGVAWQFAKILRQPELWAKPLEPDMGWLLVAVAGYVLAFCCWGLFWLPLGLACGGKPPPPPRAEAEFARQLPQECSWETMAIELRA